MIVQKFEEKYGTMMTPSEVADELRCHPTHVRSMCREGKLPAVRIGDRWRIHTAKFAAILEGGFDE